MAFRYYSNTINYKTSFPWIYVDEANNKLLALSFVQADDDIEPLLKLDKLYYTNAQAERILTYANLIPRVSNNIISYLYESTAFWGYQIGCTAANNLFFLREALVYTHNASASFASLNGTKIPQLWQIDTNSEGVFSRPKTFTFNKLAPTSLSSFLLGVNFTASNLANTLLILDTNPALGYRCNQTLTYTSNAKSTLVSYLPSISIAGDSTAGDPEEPRITLTATINQSGNTTIHLSSDAGTVLQKQLIANNSGQVNVSAIGLDDNQVATFYFGFENYLNVNTFAITATADGFQHSTGGIAASIYDDINSLDNTVSNIQGDISDIVDDISNIVDDIDPFINLPADGTPGNFYTLRYYPANNTYVWSGPQT